jgi:hypothetical protein
MSDDTLRITEQFAKDYDQAPADRPFGRVPYYLVELAKCGVEESDAKRLLQSATTPNHNPIRQDGHQSVGAALSPKELSLFAALS